jgi:hypothetical protein
MVPKNAELPNEELTASRPSETPPSGGPKVYRTPEVHEVGNLKQMQGHEGPHHDHPHHHHHHHG